MSQLLRSLSVSVIAYDATPLTGTSSAHGGHAARGIGRYVAGVLRALATEQADWAARHLMLVGTPATDLGWWPGKVRRTRRSSWRPQDVGWFTTPLLNRLALRGCDVVAWHANDPTAPLGGGVGARTAVTVYDLIPLIDPRVMARIRPHRRPIYRLYLRQVRRADLVIAISHVTARQVERLLSIPDERIKVVYPAIEPPGRAAPDVVIGDHPLDMLFVGVPAPHKNPTAAIDALAECRRRGHEISLRFVGPHPPADRQRLVTHAARMGVTRWVEYADRITDERLQSLYRGSVLLALSDVEGLGLPPLEALFAGGRVVAGMAETYAESMGEAVERVDAHDSAAVADAYERAAAGTAGGPPSDIVARFSPQASAAASIAAYETLLIAAGAN